MSKNRHLRDLNSLSPSIFDNTSFSGSTSTWTSSGNTIQGIGSLTGKAIKALGHVTLRGLDRVIMYPRIRSILSKFPHTDAQAAKIDGIEEIYDIVLELSSPEFYSGSIRRAALNVLLRQINRGHTHKLEKALHHDSAELEVFLRLLEECSKMPEINDVIINNFPFGSSFPAILLPKTTIQFMCRIAQKSERGCRAVLNVGYYRLLISVGEENLPMSDLAEVYRTVLSISTRPGVQFQTSRVEAIHFLARSLSPLRPRFIKTLELWDASDLKSLVGMVLENTTPHGNLLLSDVMLSTLALLRHIGVNSAEGKRKMFEAGYLDIALHLERLQHPIREYMDEFEVVLNILRLNFCPPYTEGERNQAVDVFLFQLANDHQYLFQSLVSWTTTEIEELLRTLVDKLRVIIISESREMYNNVAPHLVTFIAKNALYDPKICEAIIGAGLLNTLCSQDEENDSMKSLIIDILFV
ncbi:hypothetical protein BDZ94DRAFT_1312647 [Collybia nuda]|uniref:Uncharacterized protein n=1 Tax=Collybia nuda TaxID=64659 RepID=A0A9P6CFN9_9AGAR|nr:hypothetical protein BDZ94DRAFT_1312647 [Collybia nuda]